MGLVCFAAAVIVICFVAHYISKDYENIADEVRVQYVEEYAADLKHHNISQEEGLERMKGERSSDHAVSSTFLWTSGICLVVLFAVCLFVLPDAETIDKEPVWPLIIHMSFLAWGFISAIISVSVIKNGDVKRRIYERLESRRCPHCNAPLSYFHTDNYRSDEYYFQKKVSKYDMQNHFSYDEVQNWIKYKENDIYTCTYCGKKDNIVSVKEERIDR